METIIIYIALILTGLCFGSFAGATVWRLRARQLIDDKKQGEEYDEKEYKKLKKLTISPITHDRSQCLNCSYTLKWYDLIPVLSWLILKGKCRQCRTKIGYLEPFIEIGLALFFVVSYIYWPYALVTPLQITQFILWLISGITLAILFAYDAKWFLLPDKINFSLIAIGILNVVVVFLQTTDYFTTSIHIASGVAILSGLYYFLYLISKGRWIGLGDIKLGLGLALLLADFKLAFVALFAANLIGCLLVIPPLITGKLQRDAHIPFGPLLIAGCIVAQLAGFPLIDIYLSTVL
jgi:prepilin signal peptidase PulO-like enzyme (type II secretory pathway)